MVYGIAILCAVGWFYTALIWWQTAEARDTYFKLLEEARAELTRLTDRDARGRFVRKEPK
jgi:hypothetical protein